MLIEPAARFRAAALASAVVDAVAMETEISVPFVNEAGDDREDIKPGDEVILIVENGVSKAFGPRDEVLKAHVRNYAQVAGGIGQAPAPQPQVREANG